VSGKVSKKAIFLAFGAYHFLLAQRDDRIALMANWFLGAGGESVKIDARDGVLGVGKN
jgi:hypothetical protein